MSDIENHMVIDVPDCGEISQNAINSIFEMYFNNNHLSSPQEVFLMWAEAYDEAHEIMLGNEMQKEKASRDFLKYSAESLNEDFEYQTGYKADFRSDY